MSSSSSSSSSAALLACESRKRAPSHDSTDIHHPASKRPASGSAGPEDHLESSKSSSQQSEATKLDNGCQTNVVEKSQSLGQANTTQPESAGTSEGQGTQVSSLKEEPNQTNGAASCDYNTEKNADDQSDQPPHSIDENVLQQVVVAFDEAEESQEERASSVKESITMNPSLEPTFLSILGKYGDITKDCPLEPGYMLNSVLELVCKVVQELQKKHLTEVDRDLLDSYYLVVNNAEKFKLNVGWLRTRLDEIKDAVELIVKTKKMSDENNRHVEQIKNKKKDLDSMKAELEKLKYEVEQNESLLNLKVLVTEELSKRINDQALKIQQFKDKPLMEPF